MAYPLKNPRYYSLLAKTKAFLVQKVNFTYLNYEFSNKNSSPFLVRFL